MSQLVAKVFAFRFGPPYFFATYTKLAFSWRSSQDGCRTSSPTVVWQSLENVCCSFYIITFHGSEHEGRLSNWRIYYEYNSISIDRGCPLFFCRFDFVWFENVNVFILCISFQMLKSSTVMFGLSAASILAKIGIKISEIMYQHASGFGKAFFNWRQQQKKQLNIFIPFFIFTKL